MGAARRLLLFYCAAALVALSAGASAGQDSPGTVMIHSYGDKGPASVVAFGLEGDIGKGLLEKCIDYNSESNVKALLEWEKAGQLLGKEDNQQLLENVVDLFGVRYVLAITVLTNPDGQVSSAVWLFDRMKGERVAERRSTAATAEAALEGTESLAAGILEDISALFKNRCVEHWSGTVTSHYLHKGAEKKTNTFRGGDGGTNISTTTQSWRTEDIVEVFAQAGTAADGSQQTVARVVHAYGHHEDYTKTDQEAVWCRPRGAASHWERLNRKATSSFDERGKQSATVPLHILVDERKGTFSLSVQYPALTTRWERNESSTRFQCGGDSQPQTETTNGEGSPQSESYTEAGIMGVRGEIDPGNPGLLIGSQTSGDPETGQTTLKWNLHRIKTRNRSK